MEYDHNEDYLYIADTGNNRIAVHDARSGDEGGSYGPNYDGIGRQVAYEGGDCWTLVDGESIEDMGRPSGLALHNDMIFTNDNRSGRIFAFDLDGNLLDWLDTGLEEGALMGMEFDADGNLWLVDAVNDEVLRISVGS
jgi:sugar lactone lactonase YvrE